MSSRHASKAIARAASVVVESLERRQLLTYSTLELFTPPTSDSQTATALPDVRVDTPEPMARATVAGGVRLAWPAVNGARNGYEIHRRTGDGNYEMIATVRGNAAMGRLGGRVSYLDLNLQPGEYYTYRIRGVGPASTRGQWSETVSVVVDKKALDPQVGRTPAMVAASVRLAAYATSGSSSQLSWSHLPDAANGYQIQRRFGDDAYATIATLTNEQAVVDVNGQISFADSGLLEGEGYTYRVRPLGVTGNEAAWSNEYSVLIPRVSQTTDNFVLAGEGSTLTLNTIADTHARSGTSAAYNFGSDAWNGAKSGTGDEDRIAFYKFDLSSVAGGTASVKLRLNGRLSAADGTRTFLIKAVEESWTETTLTYGSKPSLGATLGSFNVSSTTDGWYEVDITNYVAAKIAAGTSIVSFAVAGSASSTAYFRINSKESGSNSAQLAVTLDAATSVRTPTADTHVRAGTYASNNYGNDAGNNTKASATTDEKREGYYRFELGGAMAGTVTQAKIRFNGRLNTSDGTRTFNLYSVSNTSWTETGLTWNNKPAADSGGALGSFTVSSTSDGWYEVDVTSYIQGKLGNSSQVSFVLQGAANSTAYFITNSKESGIASAQLVMTLANQNAPSAPTNLQATQTTPPVTLTWTDNSSDETGFVIQRRVANGTWANIAAVGANVTTYPDASVLGSTAYEYQVRSVRGTGVSAWSSSATITTGASTSTTMEPVADTYVSGAAQSTNYGTQNDLWVKNAAPGSTSKFGYMKFNIGSLTGAVASAKLRLWTTRSNLSDSNLQFAIADVSDDTWTETGMVYTNRPTISGTLATVTMTNDTEFHWYEVDLTSHVKPIVAGSDTYFSIATLGVTSTSAEWQIKSRETTTGYDPQLTIVTVDVTQTPAAPTNLHATGVAATGATTASVSLAWTDNSSDESGFKLWRRPVGGTWLPLGTLAANATTYSDTTAATDSTYEYQIAATNSVGDSSYVILTGVNTPPTAASGLSVAATTTTSVSLAWTDNSTTETEYRVERRVTGDVYYSTIASGLAANATSYTDPAAVAGTQYDYRVRAIRGTLDGWASPPVQAGPKLPAPSGLSKLAATATSLTISWTDNTTNETGFQVERRIGAGAWTQIAAPLADAVSYVDTLYAADVDTYYRVRSAKNGQLSDWSNELAVPAQPTNFGVIGTTATSVKLQWKDLSAVEQGYRVERRLTSSGPGGAYATIATLGPNTKEYTDSSGLTPATQYDYRVIGYLNGTDSLPVGPVQTFTMPLADPVVLPEFIYKNDFENGAAGGVAAPAVTAGWSTTTTSVTPVGARKFLGEFGNQTVTLTLNGIPAHSKFTVDFDLFVIRSWDGDLSPATPNGPDYFRFGANGTQLREYTFRNRWNETDTQSYPVPGSLPRSSAVENDSLGYTFSIVGPDDAVYHLSETAAHSSSTLTLTFSAANLQGLSDESWGIDNIVVKAVEEAAPVIVGAEAVTPTETWLSWTAARGDVTEHVIERSDDGGQTWDEAGRVGADVTTFLDRYLSPLQNYQYRVSGLMGDGQRLTSTVPAMLSTPEGSQELSQYRITNVGALTHALGVKTLTGGLAATTAEWTEASSAVAAVWNLLEGSIADGARSLVFGQSGAIKLQQISGGVRISIDESFPLATSFDWQDWTIDVAIEQSAGRLHGDENALGGQPFALKIEPKTSAAVSQWLVDWGDGTTSTVDPASIVDGQLAASHNYAASDDGTQDLYQISVQATAAGATLHTAPHVVSVRKGNPDEAPESPNQTDAAQRKKKILAFFSDVYSTVRYQPYSGSKKDPESVWESGAANDWDQAALLKRKIDTKYPGQVTTKFAFRVIEAPAANVMAWLGVETAAAAERVLHQAGVLARRRVSDNHWVTVNSESPYSDPSYQASAPGMITFWHAWLQVKVPGTSDDYWDLDPSWKYRRLNAQLTDLPMDVPYQSPNTSSYLDVAGTSDTNDDGQLPLEWYQEKVMDYIAHSSDLQGRISLADIGLDGPIIAKRFTNAPPQTEYRTASGSPVYWGPNATDVRDAENEDRAVGDFTHRVWVAVDVKEDTGATLATAVRTIDVRQSGIDFIGIGTKRSGSGSTKRYSPTWVIGGHTEALVAGSFGPTAKYDIKLLSVRPGESLPATVNDLTSVQEARLSVFNGKSVTERHALMINAQQFSYRLLMQQQRHLNRWATRRVDDADYYQVPLLSMTGMKYVYEYERQRSAIARLTGTLAVPTDLEFGLVSSFGQAAMDYEGAEALQNPVLLADKDINDTTVRNQLLIDLGNRDDGLIPIIDEGAGSANTRLSQASILLGQTSSALEHAVIREVLNAESVSTIRVFQRAHELGKSVITRGIDDYTDHADFLSDFPNGTDPTVQAAQAAMWADLQAGFNITFVREIISFPEGWSGFGWERLHEDGRHDFLILNSEDQTAHGGESTGTETDVGEAEEDQQNLSPYGSGAVNLYSGSLSYVEQDFAIPTPALSLGLTRYYNSDRAYVDRGFGPGWSHSFGDFLIPYTDREGIDNDPLNGWTVPAPRVVMMGGDGSRWEFYLETDGAQIATYRNPSGVYGEFTFNKSSRTYRYVEKDGTYRRFQVEPENKTSFRLQEVGDRFGNKLGLEYYDESSSSRTTGIELAYVTYVPKADAAYQNGNITRRLQFVWEDGHITEVSDFAGRTWQYNYGVVGSGRTEFLLSKSEPKTATNASGNPALVSVADQLETRYTYYSGSVLDGRLHTVDRFSNGQTQSPTQKRGKVSGYGFEYYPNGRVFAIQDPDLNVEYYSYDLFSGLEPGNDDASRTYTASATLVDRRGNATETVYDDNGLSVWILKPDGTMVQQGWEQYRDAPLGDGENPVPISDPQKASYRLIWQRSEVGLYNGIYYQRDASTGTSNGDVVRNAVGVYDDLSEDYASRGRPQSGTSSPVMPDGGVVTDTDYATNNPYHLPSEIVVQPGSSEARHTLNVYDAIGRLSQTTDPAGNITKFGYFLNGQVKYQWLPRWTTVPSENQATGYRSLFRVEYEYDARGSGQVRYVKREDSDGDGVTEDNDWYILSSASHDETGLGRVLMTSDGTKAGSTARVVEFEYDVLGRKVEETTYGRAIVRATPGDEPAVDANAPLRTTYEYDGDWLRRVYTPGTTGIQDPNPDRDGRKVTEYTYDRRGNRVTTADLQTGATTTNYYDGNNNVLASVDAVGRRTDFYYDQRNRRTEAVLPDNSFAQTVYDGAGRVVAAHKPSGDVFGYRLDATSASTNRYDQSGRLVESTDALGQRTLQTLNDFGEVTQSEYFIPGVSGRYSMTTALHDPLGRVIEQGGTDMPIVHTDYDQNGNVVKQQTWIPGESETVRTARFAYDTLDHKTLEGAGERIATVLTAQQDSAVITLERHGLQVGDRVWVSNNAGSNLGVRYVTAVANADHFTIGVAGQTNGATLYVLTSVNTHEYDLAGRTLVSVDGRGRVTRNEYDLAGRVINKIAPDPDLNPMTGTNGSAAAPVTTFNYFADGSVADQFTPSTSAATGDTSASDQRSKTSFRYLIGSHGDIAHMDIRIEKTDALGRVSSTILDKAGQTIGNVDALSRVTQYTLDARGRQAETQLPDPGDGTHGAPITVNEYDAAGNLRFSDTSDGVTRDRAHSTTEYDALGRATRTRAYVGEGAKSDVTAWQTQDQNGDVLVKLYAGGLSVTAGDSLLVWNGQWSVRRTGSAGDQTPSTQLADSGSYYASVYRVDGTGSDAGGQFVTVRFSKGNSYAVSVFLPTITGISPRIQKARVLQETSQTYRANNVETSTDARGATSKFEYDKAGRKTAVLVAHQPGGVPAETLEASVYNAFGELESVTRYAQDAQQGARTTEYSYDILGRQVASTVDPSGLNLTTHTAYDAVGQVLGTTDARGFTTTFEYDQLGRKTRQTLPDPDGAGAQSSPETTYRYDPAGNPIGSTDSLGRESATQYDVLNRATISAAGGRVASVAASANLATVTLANHGLTSGDLVLVTIPGVAALSGVRQVTVVDTHTFEFTSDGATGSYSGVVYANSSRTLHDEVGNVEYTIDARGKGTQFVYNDLNRKIAVIAPDPDGSGAQTSPTTTFKYGISGDVREMTSPRGNVSGAIAAEHTSYTQYDLLGRKTDEQLPDADPGSGVSRPTLHYSYDAAGNLVSVTDARGFETTYAYDWAGRKTLQRSSTGAISQIAYNSGTGYADMATSPHGMTAGDHLYLVIDGTGETAYDGVVVAAVVVDEDTLRFKPNGVPAQGSQSHGGMTYAASVSEWTYDNIGNTLSVKDAYGAQTSFEYDNANRKVAETLPDPDGSGGPGTAPRTTFGYDANGNLLWTTDARGNDRIATGAIIGGSALTAARARQDNINTTTFQYDALNRKILQKQADANPSDFSSADIPETTFSYDAVGNVITTTAKRANPRDDVSLSVYDSANRVVASGRDARSATLTQDGTASTWMKVALASHGLAVGDLAVVRSGTDGSLSGAYPVTQLAGTDAFYVDMKRPISSGSHGQALVACFGAATGYDANGNARRSTDALGRTTNTEYDALNRKTSQALPAVDHDNNSGTSAVRPLTTWEYDANGNVTQVIDALGNLPENAATRQDHATITTYDALNRVIQVQSPVPETGLARPTADTDYDLAGNVVATTDARGFVTTFGYDALNRQIRTQTPDADGNSGTLGDVSVSTSSFDPNGNLIYSITPRGNLSGVGIGVPTPSAYTSYSTYDRLNRQTVSVGVDPDGLGGELASMVRTGYDVLGNVIWTVDPLGNAQFTNNPSSSQISSMVTYNIHTSTTAYDDLNRVKLQYDANADSDTQSDNDTPITSFSYDTLGNLLNRADSNGNVTSYEYDEANRTKSETVDTLPGAGGLVTRDWEYDAAGNLRKYTNRNRQEMRYDYDALNRKTSEVWLADTTPALPQRTMSFAYDINGRRIEATDDDSAYAYTYDNLDRVKTTTRGATSDTPEVVITHAYNSNGDLIETTTDLDGTLDVNERIAYDAQGRITAIRQNTPKGSKQVSYAYDVDGNTTEKQLWSGATTTSGWVTPDSATAPALPGDASVVSTTTYDRSGRMTSLSHQGDAGLLAEYRGSSSTGSAISYDENGRVINLYVEVPSNTREGAYSYTYDANDQLLDAQFPQSADSEDYSYDNEGNRTNPGYATGADNRLSSDGTSSYSYDDEGNIVVRDGSGGDDVSYVFDQSNRLVRADVAGVLTVTYSYDLEGRRLSKDIDFVTGTDIHERYVYESSGRLLAALDENQNVLNRYLNGVGDVAPVAEELSQQSGDESVRWLLGDWLGSVRDVADAVGDPLRHIQYTAFGGELDLGGAVTATNPLPRFGYTGQEQDRETGLVYMNARYYDPHVGRFVSQDPIGFEGGYDNVYSYVGNNSTNLTDPTGMGGFFDDVLGFDDDGGLGGAFRKMGHWWGDTLTDFGGSLSNIFGIDSFSLNLGFINFSFGQEYFSFGFGLPIPGTPIMIGPDLALRDGPGGIDTDVGGHISLGLMPGASAGLSYMGSSWTASANAGWLSGSVTYDTHGVWSGGLSANLLGYGATDFGASLSYGLNFGPHGVSGGFSAGMSAFTDAYGQTFDRYAFGNASMPSWLQMPSIGYYNDGAVKGLDDGFYLFGSRMGGRPAPAPTRTQRSNPIATSASPEKLEVTAKVISASPIEPATTGASASVTAMPSLYAELLNLLGGGQPRDASGLIDPEIVRQVDLAQLESDPSARTFSIFDTPQDPNRIISDGFESLDEIRGLQKLLDGARLRLDTYPLISLNEDGKIVNYFYIAKKAYRADFIKYPSRWMPPDIFSGGDWAFTESASEIFGNDMQSQDQRFQIDMTPKFVAQGPDGMVYAFAGDENPVATSAIYRQNRAIETKPELWEEVLPIYGSIRGMQHSWYSGDAVGVVTNGIMLGVDVWGATSLAKGLGRGLISSLEREAKDIAFEAASRGKSKWGTGWSKPGRASWEGGRPSFDPKNFTWDVPIGQNTIQTAGAKVHEAVHLKQFVEQPGKVWWATRFAPGSSIPMYMLERQAYQAQAKFLGEAYHAGMPFKSGNMRLAATLDASYLTFGTIVVGGVVYKLKE